MGGERGLAGLRARQASINNVVFTWLMLSARASLPVSGGGGTLRLAYVAVGKFASMVKSMTVSSPPLPLSKGCL
ncbi:hypothetical protein BU14_1995s0001 [Porphyra umbilicalis]|uniref:Uncharacterized protein n=1 Tax=Porphyra umbilicalis TaxID=2786 RepID=A0A1X6NK65_PORUM|nr:hypothetical protein BU14_1995s0001 [Porphyra umbilicalis]|eukprot:OSX68988.1 hypothetical protein BU14_1995s0001 [Porphyra umbilicalis]